MPTFTFNEYAEEERPRDCPKVHSEQSRAGAGTHVCARGNRTLGDSTEGRKRVS